MTQGERKLRTRERIEAALSEALLRGGSTDSITFKSIAAGAGVTEMTVYRYFPTREDLLKGLWSNLNRRMGERIGMPESARELLAQTGELFEGFDKIPTLITASLLTEQGREMRSSLDGKRRAAFTAIVREATAQSDSPSLRARAAVIQLLHSAYAWISMREQWGLTGKESGRAAHWAIETLLKDLSRPVEGTRRKSR